LAEYLKNLNDIEICGTAEDSVSGLELIKNSECDLAVVDISLKGSGSGLELTKSIKSIYPKVNVLVLSMHDENLYAERAIRAGARGYVMKQEMTDTIAKAIRQIISGKIYLSENISMKIIDGLMLNKNEKKSDIVEILSDRELEIFQLVGEGYRSQDIATKLCLSIKTIDTYKLRIKEKLNLSDSTELSKTAINWVHDKN
jgi:DNA-binding NarL/FixJ family response regulator